MYITTPVQVVLMIVISLQAPSEDQEWKGMLKFGVCVFSKCFLCNFTCLIDVHLLMMWVL